MPLGRNRTNYVSLHVLYAVGARECGLHVEYHKKKFEGNVMCVVPSYYFFGGSREKSHNPVKKSHFSLLRD